MSQRPANELVILAKVLENNLKLIKGEKCIQQLQSTVMTA